MGNIHSPNFCLHSLYYKKLLDSYINSRFGEKNKLKLLTIINDNNAKGIIILFINEDQSEITLVIKILVKWS